MTAIGKRQRLLDGLAISASGLCLVHCLALPAMLIVLPTLAGALALPDDFHLIALLIAVPTSLVAIAFGYLHHRRPLPALLAGIGLMALTAAAVLVHDQRSEAAVTVAGSLLLAAAHMVNLRLVGQAAPAPAP